MTASITHLNEYRAGRAPMVPSFAPSGLTVTASLQPAHPDALKHNGLLMAPPIADTESSLQEGDARWSRHTVGISPGEVRCRATEKPRGFPWPGVAVIASLLIFAGFVFEMYRWWRIIR